MAGEETKQENREEVECGAVVVMSNNKNKQNR